MIRHIPTIIGRFHGLLLMLLFGYSAMAASAETKTITPTLAVVSPALTVQTVAPPPPSWERLLSRIWSIDPYEISLPLTLRASGADFDTITAHSVALAASDGRLPMPANNIRAGAGSSLAVKDGDFVDLPSDISVSGVHSAHYTGKLYLNAISKRVVDPNNTTISPVSVEVPVDISIKDYWLWPLIAIITSTIFSYGFAWYRAQLQPRDEITTASGDLQYEMDRNPYLSGHKPIGETFRDRIESSLGLVRSSLRRADLDEARAALKRAQDVWERWDGQQNLWAKQLQNLQSLRWQIQANDGFADSSFLESLVRVLNSQEEGAPDLADARTLEATVNSYIEYFNTTTRIVVLRNVVSHISNADKHSEYQEKAESLARRLNVLDVQSTNFASEYASLKTELNNTISDAKTLVESPSSNALLSAASDAPSVFQEPKDPKEAFSIKDVAGARRRLRFYSILVHASVVFMLISLGFYNQYIQNATFGSQPFRDYFTLIAWGFGAETLSRGAITSAILSTSLPNLPQLR